jgi:YgiT-type zinc finger domain-containing protein
LEILCLSEIERKNEQLAVIRCGEYKFMKNFMDCNCKNMKREKVTREIPLAGKKVLLKNVTAWVCQDCGEPFFNGKFLLKLEKKLLKEAKNNDK